MTEPRALTPTEARWVARLRRTLAACPPTLELATIGDRCLSVWCRERAQAASAADIGLHDGGAASAGVEVADVVSACLIHGVSG